ncbi:hypothetical protein BLX24_11035 [Arsenicibacter rosenii]|uniref:RES domain-containing protein n=1 Tax=Arsenicibacter rosenii TaxID=1750698 RepID=A0A1S2VL67_9BACT|nr:hypothetical protein BLX24_11035 [Arsenicibacter rosenii]
MYTATSASLAILEVLAHLTFDPKAGAPAYNLVRFEVDDPLIAMFPVHYLSSDWKSNYTKTNTLLSIWYQEENPKYMGFKVPSALVDFEYNCLLNPNHSAFKKLTIASNFPFPLDTRLYTRFAI